MYSMRVSGFDRYSCSAFARRSSAINPPSDIDTRNTKIDCCTRNSRNVCGVAARNLACWKLDAT
jgi:hypothetical protein